MAKETIDTSIDGLKYVGINLTDKQYEELQNLNLQAICHSDIPVFHVIMVLKTLGLLPPEMINEESNNESNSDFNGNLDDGFQRRYGKRKHT